MNKFQFVQHRINFLSAFLPFYQVLLDIMNTLQHKQYGDKRNNMHNVQSQSYVRAANTCKSNHIFSRQTFFLLYNSISPIIISLFDYRLILKENRWNKLYIILDILQSKSGTSNNRNEEVKSKVRVNVMLFQIRLWHFKLARSVFVFHWILISFPVDSTRWN